MSIEDALLDVPVSIVDVENSIIAFVWDDIPVLFSAAEKKMPDSDPDSHYINRKYPLFFWYG